MKQALLRWADSDVGHSFRTSPMAMVAAAIAAVCVFCAVFAGLVAVVLATQWINRQAQLGGAKVAVLGVDVQLAHASRDELGELAAEVEDDDVVAHAHHEVHVVLHEHHRHPVGEAADQLNAFLGGQLAVCGVHGLKQ